MIELTRLFYKILQIDKQHSTLFCILGQEGDSTGCTGVGEVVNAIPSFEHSSSTHAWTCISSNRIHVHVQNPSHFVLEQRGGWLPMHIDMTPNRQSLPRRFISLRIVATQRAPEWESRFFITNPTSHCSFSLMLQWCITCSSQGVSEGHCSSVYIYFISIEVELFAAIYVLGSECLCIQWWSDDFEVDKVLLLLLFIT